MRRHDWTGFAALAALIAAVVALLRGHPASALAWLVLAAALAALTRYWSLTHPAPMPHFLRWTLLIPRGNQSPEHLRAILEPSNGERFLEIGPGIGIHAIPMAAALAPGGTLDVLDMQPEMLADLMRQAAEVDVTNIIAKTGDAQKLPYDDRTFDGAYLVGVLGEIPDGDATLRELKRVLKPTGRLVVGEVLLDPDYVSFPSLDRRLHAAGFEFDRKEGGRFSYLARFRPN